MVMTEYISSESFKFWKSVLLTRYPSNDRSFFGGDGGGDEDEESIEEKRKNPTYKQCQAIDRTDRTIQSSKSYQPAYTKPFPAKSR